MCASVAVWSKRLRDSQSLWLLFTSAYNAISFYSAPLPLFAPSPILSLPSPQPCSVIVCVRIMRPTQRERRNKTSSLFQRFSSFRRYSPVYPWRFFPCLRISFTSRYCAFSVTERITMGITRVIKCENTLIYLTLQSRRHICIMMPPGTFFHTW